MHRRKGDLPSGRRKRHQFGGAWTTRKLEVLGAYLSAYTTALKDKPTATRPFKKGFIDAFAGTGYRDGIHRQSVGLDGQSTLFPDLAGDEPQDLLEGSATLALQTEPRFDKYIFIERRADRCAELEALRLEFPDRGEDIEIIQGEANELIQEISAKDWSSHRAVLFLDPYGMQVEWATIEAIARTEAIDLWLLFPLGIGVNRLLTRSGEIPAAWQLKLNQLLGTEDWYDEFYKVEATPTLFGTDQETVSKASMETIGHYFIDRLKGIFAGVAEKPGVLRNSVNNPLFLLCFAAANQRVAPTALRIANHLLQELR